MYIPDKAFCWMAGLFRNVPWSVQKTNKTMVNHALEEILWHRVQSQHWFLLKGWDFNTLWDCFLRQSFQNTWGPICHKEWASPQREGSRGWQQGLSTSLINKGAPLRNAAGLVTLTWVRQHCSDCQASPWQGQAHRDKAGLRSNKKLSLWVRVQASRAQHQSWVQPPGKGGEPPVSTFSHCFFFNCSAPNSHSCTISELGLLYLENNGKQLSIPLVCLQAEN